MPVELALMDGRVKSEQPHRPLFVFMVSGNGEEEKMKLDYLSRATNREERRTRTARATARRKERANNDKKQRTKRTRTHHGCERKKRIKTQSENERCRQEEDTSENKIHRGEQ